MAEEIGFRARLAKPYDEAVAAVRVALKAHGFGVITEIDVRATVKEKLGKDFRPYTILGACNPALAHRALDSDLDVGLLLPCNVTVYEEDGGSVVTAVDPMVLVGLLRSETLREVAEEARRGLQSAMESLSGE